MTNQHEVRWVGVKELKDAIRRNPRKVADETNKFITRGLSKYRRGTMNRPWRVGGQGGGAPVDTGNLRDTHVTKISKFEGTFGPNTRAARYARWVHEGTRRVEGRPWLDYVKEQNEHRIQSLYRELLRNISSDLAR